MRQAKSLSFTAALSLVALALALIFATNASAEGGDFQIDFVAAEPTSYGPNPASGGGAFNDRTINVDVVETLNGGDFVCGDIVSFLPRVEVDAGAQVSPPQKITMDFSFAASTTNGGQVGFSDIVAVDVNYGDVGGDGPGGTDSGISDDGGSTARLTAETPPNPPFTGDLLGTVELDDLEPGEAVVVRIDVRLDCGTLPATGVVQSALLAATNTEPDGGSINVGNQTINLNKAGDVRPPNGGELDPVEIHKMTTDTGVKGKWRWKVGKWTTSKLEQWATGPRPYAFRVLVDSHGFKIKSWRVSSRITLTNPNDEAVSGSLTDVLPGFSCTPEGNGLPVEVTIPAGESLGVDTVCTTGTDPGGEVTNTATFTPNLNTGLDPVSDDATTEIDQTPPPGALGQKVVLRDPMYKQGKKPLARLDAVNGPTSKLVRYRAKLIPPKKPGACWWHHNTAHLFDAKRNKKVKSSNKVSVRICRPATKPTPPKGGPKKPTKGEPWLPPVGKSGVPVVGPKLGGPKVIPPKYRTRLATRIRAPKRVYRATAFRAKVITINRTKKRAYGTLVRVHIPKGLALVKKPKGVRVKGRYAYWAVKTLGPKRKLTRSLRLVATKAGKRRIVARSNARNAKRSAAKKVVRVKKPPAPSS